MEPTRRRYLDQGQQTKGKETHRHTDTHTQHNIDTQHDNTPHTSWLDSDWLESNWLDWPSRAGPSRASSSQSNWRRLRLPLPLSVRCVTVGVPSNRFSWSPPSSEGWGPGKTMICGQGYVAKDERESRHTQWRHQIGEMPDGCPRRVPVVRERTVGSRHGLDVHFTLRRVGTSRHG